MQREDIARQLAAAIQRARRRLNAAHADAKAVEGAPRLIAEAELLKTVQSRVRGHEASVTTIDYAQTPPRSVTIALTPGRPIREQIERRFRQGKRLMQAEAKVLARIAAVEAELSELERLSRELDADGPLSEATLASIAEHVATRAPAGAATKRPEKPVKPYREYESSTGRAIWVGKGARANDLLTFKHASPHAVWLHASAWQGAHVVIQKKRDERLDAITLREAALLAAHFSKAPKGAAVEIAYTEVKFVRKFRGAKPGQVLITREKHERVLNDVEPVKKLMRQ
jgi:predicted ribosome quality control (RQC) complex YloA/Tae2 family protein